MADPGAPSGGEEGELQKRHSSGEERSREGRGGGPSEAEEKERRDGMEGGTEEWRWGAGRPCQKP